MEWIIFGIIVLAVFVAMVVNAPEGYEDEEGFHYGKEDKFKGVE